MKHSTIFFCESISYNFQPSSQFLICIITNRPCSFFLFCGVPGLWTCTISIAIVEFYCQGGLLSPQHATEFVAGNLDASLTRETRFRPAWFCPAFDWQCLICVSVGIRALEQQFDVDAVRSREQKIGFPGVGRSLYSLLRWERMGVSCSEPGEFHRRFFCQICVVFATHLVRDTWWYVGDRRLSQLRPWLRGS